MAHDAEPKKGADVRAPVALPSEQCASMRTNRGIGQPIGVWSSPKFEQIAPRDGFQVDMLQDGAQYRYY